MTTALLVVAIGFVLANLYYFFRNKAFKYGRMDFMLFVNLFLVMIGIWLAFAGIYYALSMDKPAVLENTQPFDPIEVTWSNMIYFSGVTLLSIGYGDMVPTGIAKFFALLEAGLGILLPAAFFIQSLQPRAVDQPIKRNTD